MKEPVPAQKAKLMPDKRPPRAPLASRERYLKDVIWKVFFCECELGRSR